VDGYVQTALGAFLSVALFLITYRQTVGARRERARAANTDLERMLTKRIVLERYLPEVGDLDRLIRAKAREQRVRHSDLARADELLDSVFARVLEDDLIAPDHRAEVLRALSLLISAAEDKPTDDDDLAESAPRARQQVFLLLAAAAATSFVGALVSVVPSGQDGSTFAAALGASFAVVGAALVFLRLRETQEDTRSQMSPQAEALRFEREVAEVLRKAGARDDIRSRPDRGVDFIADLDGRTLAVEVKASRHRLPGAVLRDMALRASRVAREAGADELLVVLRDDVPLPRASDDGYVRFVTKRDLAAYLATRRNGT
jgi:hypothetical protein